jgi:hypothetical protein
MVLGMHRMTVARFAGAALAVTFLMGGCSAGAKKDQPPDVASLETSGPAAASPSAAVDDQRPLMALDATDEERERLVKVWTDCVTKTGGPGYEEPKMIYKYLSEGNAKAKRVEAACATKMPESYEERQKRHDVAAFRDNQRQWYACAKKEGYKLTEPSEDGEFGLTEIGPQGDFASPKIEACRLEAFRE